MFFELFKLRIGVVIGFTALAGLAMTPGPSLDAWRVVALALAVTLASAAAGAFNQFVERDLDVTMKRTRSAHSSPDSSSQSRAGFPRSSRSLQRASRSRRSLSMARPLRTRSSVHSCTRSSTRSGSNAAPGGTSSSAVSPGALPSLPARCRLARDACRRSADLRGPALPVDAASFLESRHRFPRRLRRRRVPMLPVVVGDRACRARHPRAVPRCSSHSRSRPRCSAWAGLYLAVGDRRRRYFLFTSLRLVFRPYSRNALANFFASLFQLTLLLSRLSSIRRCMRERLRARYLAALARIATGIAAAQALPAGAQLDAQRALDTHSARSDARSATTR